MTFSVLAPAKINLGLEVLRKREDGFHDIATVFQTTSVFDRLHFTPSKNDDVRIIDLIEQIDDNLVTRALDLARQDGLIQGAWHIALEKRIPSATGLGGASADAAATLVTVCRGEEQARSALALHLGSDVPFLLRGGSALASGRGEVLRPLPPLRSAWIVLASPHTRIERKTARLYGALRSDDFSDGSRIDRVAAALRARQLPDAGDLANTFERPLYEMLPEVIHLRNAFLSHGAPFVAISGAGPTHYTIVPSLRSAIGLARRLAENPPLDMRVLVSRPTAQGPLIRGEKTIDPPEPL